MDANELLVKMQEVIDVVNEAKEIANLVDEKIKLLTKTEKQIAENIEKKEAEFHEIVAKEIVVLRDMYLRALTEMEKIEELKTENKNAIR